eukprot:scaffold66847_cov57-Attheya_sp.AAC.1
MQQSIGALLDHSLSTDMNYYMQDNIVKEHLQFSEMQDKIKKGFGTRSDLPIGSLCSSVVSEYEKFTASKVM